MKECLFVSLLRMLKSEWVDQGPKCVDDCHPPQNVNKKVLDRTGAECVED